MGLKAGMLLWHRKTVLLLPGGGPANLVDTELTQLNRNFADYSPGEPGLPSVQPVLVSPPAPQTPGSRIQVVPMMPIFNWAAIAHLEPLLDPIDGKIKVQFFNGSGGPIIINVLFWDPHSIVGPGKADAYFVNI